MNPKELIENSDSLNIFECELRKHYQNRQVLIFFLFPYMMDSTNIAQKNSLYHQIHSNPNDFMSQANSLVLFQSVVSECFNFMIKLCIMTHSVVS